MKSSSYFSYALALVALLMAACAGALSARADLIVIESTTPSVKVGSRLAPGDAIAIPTGAYVRTVLPSGKTQTIKGPYSGSVADLEKGQARNDGLMAWIRNILQTGGSTEATPGATRSIAPARVRAGFSWSAVPVSSDGSVCVEKGAKLQLVRPPSAQPGRVVVVDVAKAAQGEVQWEAGSDTAAWPAGVAPRPDGVYTLLVQDRQRRQVTLRVLERLPAEADVLTELHRLGCRFQFEAWMRDRLAASK